MTPAERNETVGAPGTSTLFPWAKIKRVQILLGLLLLLFIGLALAVTSPVLRGWDAHVSRETQEHASPFLLLIARSATNLGQWFGLLPLSLPLSVWLYRAGRPVAARFLPLTILGHLFSVWIKLLFHRPRPGVADNVNIFYPAGGSSFPSGHALAATMFFGFLAFLLTLIIARKPLRYALVTLSLFVGAAICWSRVYVGAHFLSDVVGGILAGLVFLIATIVAYKHFGVQEINHGAANTGAS